jgi:hypothetical protein
MFDAMLDDVEPLAGWTNEVDKDQSIKQSKQRPKTTEVKIQKIVAIRNERVVLSDITFRKPRSSPPIKRNVLPGDAFEDWLLEPRLISSTSGRLHSCSLLC